MNMIQIKTIGEVALPSTMNSSVGYLYDIPTDDMGIPYLPVNTILETNGHLFPEVRIGFAHPDGYMSLVRNANILKENIPNCLPMIRSYFLNERFLPKKMCNIRSLKAGQVLNAHIFFEEKDREAIANALAQITHIGVSDGTITGEVSVKLISSEYKDEKAPALSAKCRYSSLDISYLLRTPTCIHMPFNDGSTTASYIPGSTIRDELMQNLKSASVDWEGMVFSNAYLSMNGQRLMPTPICVSVVKLDKEQLRYRLAPGKNPRITEQDKGLDDTYTNECHKHLTRYAAPETEHILSNTGVMYNALSSGQLFMGTIYGSDEQIRAITAHLSRNPITNIGKLQEEGFGEVFRTICQANEKEIPDECLQQSFDVCCVSNTLLLNEKGMPTCRAEDLLAEIEYALGIFGKLRIAGKYTGVYHDYSRNHLWQEDRNAVRCFAKGSILRLEVIGDPIDIFPIRHCFIGERTQEGYGEICTWPAQGGYYRLAEKVALPRYDVYPRETPRNIILGARMTKSVITAILKDKVKSLAVLDQGEYAAGTALEELIPTELLDMFRDQYDPLLTSEEVSRWYCEKLKGGPHLGQDS